MTDDRLLLILAEHGSGWVDNGKPDKCQCYCGYKPWLGELWHRHVADEITKAGYRRV